MIADGGYQRCGLILALVIGCGHGGDRGTAQRGERATAGRDASVTDAAAIDAAAIEAAPTVRWRADVVVPVVALAERRFVPLAGWLLPVDGAVAVVPTGHPVPTRIEATPNVSVQPRVVAGDGLPASWRAAVGTSVAAYDRAGQRCATTISAVMWLGLDNGEAELGEAPIVVGELATAPGCDPMVITDRAEPRFAVPTKASPTQHAAVARAFAKLPGVTRQGRDRKQRGDLDATLFVGADGAWMVAAAEFQLREAACDPQPEVVRAVFALPASGAPTLVAELDDELGTRTRGVFDSDRDGQLELITGHGRFDHGDSLITSYVGYRELGPPAAVPDGPATDVEFATYYGCD